MLPSSQIVRFVLRKSSCSIRSSNRRILIGLSSPSRCVGGGSHCYYSSGVRGHDITLDSLMMQHGRPKIILQGHGPSGFDVFQAIVKKKILEKKKNSGLETFAYDDDNDGTVDTATDGTLHFNGSILAFPHGCFFWKVQRLEDMSLEMLAPILLHEPKIEYFFVGCSQPQNKVANLSLIKNELYRQHGITMEVLSIANAMGTFNILNAEDRPVAVGLIANLDEVDNE